MIGYQSSFSNHATAPIRREIEKSGSKSLKNESFPEMDIIPPPSNNQTEDAIPVVEKNEFSENNVDKIIEMSNDSESIKVVAKEPEFSVEPQFMSTQEMGSSLNSSVLNMMNTIIGAGVLSIPNTVRKAGLLGSFILLFVSLYLSLEGAHMLSDTAVYTKQDSYGFIAKKLGIPKVGLIGDIAMIVFDLGVAVAYLIVSFQQFIDLAHAWGGIAMETLTKWKPLICVVIALCVDWPLLSIPSIDALRFTSVVSLVCVIVFVIVSIIKGTSMLFSGELSYAWIPRDWSLLPGAISVFFTAMCCHVNIPKMTSELRLPSKTRFGDKTKKMKRVSTISFLCCGSIYFIVGAFGYLAYGDSIGANLLDNFSKDEAWYLNIVKLAYAFVVTASYPALSFAALVSFDKMVFKNQPRPTGRRVSEAFVWTAIAAFIAIVLPELDVVFGVTGSLCGILLNFAIPAYYFICMAKKEKAKEVTSRIPLFNVSDSKVKFSWFLFYLGIVADVIFTSLQLKDAIVSGF